MSAIIRGLRLGRVLRAARREGLTGELLNVLVEEYAPQARLLRLTPVSPTGTGLPQGWLWRNGDGSVRAIVIGGLG